MSTNTQNNIRNNNAAQLNTLKLSKGNKPQGTIDFSSLFTEAMGNSSPQAQLNTLENEMRQALSKQEEKKKTPETSPMAAEMAQSLVWSQKNWNTQTKPNIETNTLKPTNTNTVNTPAQPNPEKEQATAQAQKTQQTTTGESNTQQAAQAPKAAEKQANNTAETQSQTTNTPTPNTSALPQASSGPANNTENSSAISSNGGIEIGLQPQADAPPLDKQTNLVTATPVQTQTPNPAINPTLAVPNTTATANINATTSNDDNLTTTPAIKAGDIKLTTAGQSTPNINISTNALKTTQAPTEIKTPVTQPGFAKELGQTVQWALGKNMSTVDIRINPESFGPMNMRLVQKGNEVQLIIRTQDDNSANLMSQAITGLKESMAQNGLQLGQVQIQSNTNTAQSNTNSGQQQWAQNQSQSEQQSRHHARPDNNNLSNTSEPTTTIIEPTGATPPKQPGRVDYFA